MPKRSSQKLTKTLIESAPRGAFLWDAMLPGFGLRVSPAGSRSYIIQFRSEDGRQGRTVIGKFPALTVEQARDRARDELGSVSSGGHPTRDKRARREAPTLRDLAKCYLVDHAHNSGLRPKTIRDARYVLERHALTGLGNRKVADIKMSDIRNLHGRARDAAGVYQANRLLAVLNKMFSLPEARELRPDNPCKGVRKFNEDQRWRNLSEDEVARLLNACDAYQEQNAANAIRLLLYSGARLQEALKAEWGQFDLDRGVWEKPSSHTKQKRQHLLRLNGPLLGMLQAMRADDPAGRYLFPGRDKEFDPSHPDADLSRPRSDLNNPWNWVKRRAGLDDVRLHDLRRTTASFMINAGVSIEVIGKALGHTQISTTKRYAQLNGQAQSEATRIAGDRMLAAQKRMGSKS